MNKELASGKTITINGAEIYFETRGEGEPLLLMHGGGGIGAHWKLIFAEPPAAHQLIIPDLRGHGSSTNPAMKFTIRQLALDVLSLLDELGIQRCKAIGLSLGAKTLLHLATQQPQRIESMVLVSCAPYFPEQARAIMRELSPDHRSEAEWEQMRQWHKHGDEQIRALWQQMNKFKESYDDLNFTPPYLSTITARTLIVHGDRDPLYPLSLAVEMYASIPHSSLWVIPNAGHSPIFGEVKDQFAETSMAFLDGRWEQPAQ
jgi:pimeloyl-ACP methyl ester carboxylesterase